MLMFKLTPNYHNAVLTPDHNDVVKSQPSEHATYCLIHLDHEDQSVIDKTVAAIKEMTFVCDCYQVSGNLYVVYNKAGRAFSQSVLYEMLLSISEGLHFVMMGFTPFTILGFCIPEENSTAFNTTLNILGYEVQVPWE